MSKLNKHVDKKKSPILKKSYSMPLRNDQDLKAKESKASISLNMLLMTVNNFG